MYLCPHCNRPGVSVARKLCLGPAIPATCASCGRRVGVPWSAVGAVVPFLGAMAAAWFVGPIALKVLLAGAGAAVMTVIHMAWVPLVRR
jgi:hypothetical protein